VFGTSSFSGVPLLFSPVYLAAVSLLLLLLLLLLLMLLLLSSMRSNTNYNKTKTYGPANTNLHRND
jgi:hypothetical protein